MEEIRWRMNTMPKSNKEKSIKILGEEEIIKVKKPLIVFLENVPNLLRHDKGKTFHVISSLLE